MPGFFATMKAINRITDKLLDIVGKDEETRELINAVTGMVKGCGYKVKYKPESYAATKVADRYTKHL